MTTQIIVVENRSDWKWDHPGCDVITSGEYLDREVYFKAKNVQVINLCRSYRYLSVGYYCSLLAEARRHRSLPTVKTMLDLSSKAMYGLDAENLDQKVEKTLGRKRKDTTERAFEMDVFFGRCRYEDLADLARQIFETFPCPLLRVRFEYQGRWRLAALRPVALNRLEGDEGAHLSEALGWFLKRPWRSPKSRTVLRYDMAVLHNPQDPQPPSSTKALQNFIKAGRDLGIDVELIERKDYSRLAEYDALFIRDTTRINHYTYRFAKKAESEGMVVIDDPTSILRCTNKVYLAELLKANKVPTLKTLILRKGERMEDVTQLGYPIVLKVPDGSFSQGVFKAEDHAKFLEVTERLFKDSDLILAQEYRYTEFDWRIGILNRRPIYACQYFMSKKHWQIVNYSGSGRFTEGKFKTWPVEEVPQRVVATALSAANLIGDGLYGVDLKEDEQGVYVIEVNDNPNIDAGVEDAALKGALYKTVMADFLRRMEARRGA